jgi:hypothetical protein
LAGAALSNVITQGLGSATTWILLSGRTRITTFRNLSPDANIIRRTAKIGLPASFSWAQCRCLPTLPSGIFQGRALAAQEGLTKKEKDGHSYQASFENDVQTLKQDQRFGERKPGLLQDSGFNINIVIAGASEIGISQVGLKEYGLFKIGLFKIAST